MTSIPNSPTECPSSDDCDSDTMAPFPYKTELDGTGIKGFLYMREDGLTYHRMKRYFCRCIGLIFFRYLSSDDDSCSFEMLESALLIAEIEGVQTWDGKGLLHTYQNAFKLSFRHGSVYNIDALLPEEKDMWIHYIQRALKGAQTCSQVWQTLVQHSLNKKWNSIMLITSLPGLSIDQKSALEDLQVASEAPKFENQNICSHPNCGVKFDGKTSTKRQHHCRNCGQTVCSYHSQRFISLLHYSKSKAVRTCTRCFRVQRFILSLAITLQGICQLHRVQEDATESHTVIEIQYAEAIPVSASTREEIKRIRSQTLETGFGISDAIQLLHLHRHGADEAYAVVSNMLLQLSHENMADFEFFLPQIFHMWLTLNDIQNTIKAALLMQVIAYAAYRQIRLATCLYWLTRAAIDDSCGWGYDQSEHFVPEFLFRRFCACKMLLINLEMQIQKDWTFLPDNDLPASPLQTLILQSLFTRLRILLEPITQSRSDEAEMSLVSSVGPMCEALRLAIIPPMYQKALDLEVFRYRLPQTFEEVQHVFPSVNAQMISEFVTEKSTHAIFENQIDFVRQLCDLTEKLRHLPIPERRLHLPAELENLVLNRYSFYPLGTCGDSLQRFLSVATQEGTVFTTKARAPTLIYFEVETVDKTVYEEGSDLATLNWSRRIPNDAVSKGLSSSDLPAWPDNQTISGIAHLQTAFGYDRESFAACAVACAASSELASELALQLDADGDSECATPIGSKKSSRTLQDFGSSKSGRDTPSDSADVRHGSESLVHKTNSRHRSTTDDLFDSPAAVRRINRENERFSSFLSDIGRTSSGQHSDTVSQIEIEPENGSKMLSRFELYTDTQLASIAYNMAYDILHGRQNSESGSVNDLILNGKEVLSWMIGNEIVRDQEDATWLGEELVRSGALEFVQRQEENQEDVSIAPKLMEGKASGFEPSTRTLYRLGLLALQTTPRFTQNTAKTKRAPFKRAKGNKKLSLSDFTGADVFGSQQNTSNGVAASCSQQNCENMRETGEMPGTENDELEGKMKSVCEITDQVATSNGVQEDASNHAAFTGSRRENNIDPTSSPPSQSFCDVFDVEGTMTAMQSIREAVDRIVLPVASESEKLELSRDIQILSDQLDLVVKHVSSNRQKLTKAVESAFGESFEEMRERIRLQSQRLGVLKTRASNDSSWDLVGLIVKSNDDLRQEKFCLQLIRQFQDIFDHAELPLRLVPYGIMVTSASTGMIEYLKNSTSLDALKKRDGYTTLGDHFEKTYGDRDSPKYRIAMANFVRSLAAYCLVCYLLQIKDRHNGNIMLDRQGFIIHIDYGFILGIAPGGKFSLETAPFKLPQEMIDAMGGAQSEYFKAFVILMIQGFLALREHADTILMMIAVMAHDSSYPCFLSQHPRDVLCRTERLFKLELNQQQVIKHVLHIVRKSQNSYRTWQYDVFQKITNGIHP
uniref:1-phosphatidylinositol 4-kinase n=1 Tax=Albugo laibachii Nc14 TaxID=890382 RepID=F0W0X1_9STRA|nr:phosphatidylinositol kinase (PIKG2) putative [Albugo laibachii Nc14]|eukprot:CCA14695.1 phosphatidylinositol kinase (PIKG2) putative [Albugo laibachii Nc14]